LCPDFWIPSPSLVIVLPPALYFHYRNAVASDES
jgi:hypothetical protein